MLKTQAQGREGECGFPGGQGAYMREGGREGIGSKPWTMRREVPTRALKALPKTLLATRGLPNVMHLMSASGYSRAAHAAPAWVSHYSTHSGSSLSKDKGS